MENVDVATCARAFSWGSLGFVALRLLLRGSKPTLTADPASDHQNHIERLQTALFYIPFVISAIVYETLVFQLFLVVMTVAGISEYLQIVLPETRNGFGPLDVLLHVLGGLIGFSTFYSYSLASMFLWLGFAVVVVAQLLNIIRLNKVLDVKDVAQMAYYVFGLLWIAWPLAHANVAINTMTVGGQKFGCSLLIICLLSAWVGDASAYYTGKNFGKRKAMPTVSPNKTVEGLMGCVGGAVALNVVLWAFKTFLQVSWIPPLSVVQFMSIGLIFSTFGAVGDAIESMVKRIGGIKDSGTFFPGHGGVLDRFDTFFIASAPIFYFFVYFVVDDPAAVFV